MSGSMTGADPMGGAPMIGDDIGGAPDADSDADDNVVCTITKTGDGSYMVFAGDEPEGGSQPDMSEDDADAMGDAGNAPAPNGGAPAPQGQPAASVGEALKIVMGILQDDQSSGDGSGNADQQFAAGFSGSQAPTPATGAPMKQKY